MVKSATKSKALAWHRYWDNRDALTVREAAFRCLNWNPSKYDFKRRNRAKYNEVVDSLNRAVRVGVLKALPLAWPPTGAERMYEMVPAFTPSDLAKWGAKHHPKAFPLQTSARPLEQRERTTLYGIIAALAKGKTAASITRLTEQNGHSVSERTVRNLLHQITMSGMAET